MENLNTTIWDELKTKFNHALEIYSKENGDSILSLSIEEQFNLLNTNPKTCSNLTEIDAIFLTCGPQEKAALLYALKN